MRWLAVGAAAAAAGCLAPSSLTCSDGRVCPAGTRCDDVSHVCVTVAEELACAGHGEGDDCILSEAPGKCRSGACRPFRCGDGIRNGGEACDGTDLGGQTCAKLHYYGETTGLACKKDECTFDTSGCTGACGDRVINGLELCDGADLGGADCKTVGFYEGPGLACSPFCVFDVSACKGFCGDGLVSGAESCDGAPPAGKSCLNYGFEQGLLGCSDQCTLVLDGCKMLGWSVVPAGPNRAFYGVWGSGRDDVFAVGGDAFGKALVLHWNGTGWSDLSPSFARTIVSIWGSGPRDVYAVAPENGSGDRSQVLKWDGTAWSPLLTTMTGTRLHGVWASGANDVYVVGDGGTIEQWNGSWQAQPQADFNLYSVWGSGPGDLFASGENGTGLGVILHGDGKEWTVLTHSDGMGGQIPSFPSVGRSVWGSGPNDVFVVGGDIWHFDGSAWAAMPRPLNTSARWVWGSGPGDVFFDGAADGRIVHWDGADWTSLPPFPPNTSVGPLWGSGPNDVYAVGNTIAHWTGTTEIATSLDTSGFLFPRSFAFARMWGSDAFDDVFAFGTSNYDSGLAHWDGRTWATWDLPIPRIEMVWGVRPDDLFVVAGASVLRGSGSSWATIGSFDVTLHGVWGAGVNDVFVVADAGTALHWDGGRWARSTIAPPDVILWALWGSGPQDVFAVGTGGTVVHFDGMNWRSMESGTDANLFDVWGLGPNDVYATGYDNAVAAYKTFHWDGARWSWLRDVPPSASVVRGSGTGDLFACTSDSVFIHSRLGVWEPIALSSVCTGLRVTPRRVFTVGGWIATVLSRPSVTCAGPERECNDGWDNDCDGLQDGADPDCAGRVAEQCANLADDDGDGATDCADSDCAGLPSCRRR